MDKTENTVPETKIIFREAQTVSELRALLSLRLRSFQASRMAQLVAKSDDELDVDHYDLRSSHFGLFEQQDTSETPIGYLRIFTDCPQLNGSPIHSIAKEFNIQGCGSELSGKYPSQAHAHCQGLDELIDRSRQTGETVVEPSRLSIESGRRGVLRAAFLLECAIAWWLHRNSDAAILTCFETQTKFYKRYGFRDIMQGKTYSDVIGESCRLVLTKDRVQHLLFPSLSEFAKEYSQTGAIMFRRKRTSERRATAA